MNHVMRYIVEVTQNLNIWCGTAPSRMIVTIVVRGLTLAQNASSRGVLIFLLCVSFLLQSFEMCAVFKNRFSCEVQSVTGFLFG